MPVLSSLVVYPMKSTAGIRLEESPVTPLGLPFDRRWAIFGADGEAVTARDLPALLALTARPSEDRLVISRDGETLLALPLTPDDGEAQPVILWDIATEGLSCGQAADAFFSELAGRPLRLLQMPDAAARPIPAYVGAQARDRVRFADECPLLLLSEASLAELNGRLERPVGMAHFRPNLVVRDCAAFAEDGWRKVRIGGLSFDVLQACERCVLTTIDPETQVKDPRQEPLRTLSRYRKREGGGVAFGVHLVARGEGVLRQGDEVKGLA